MQTTRSWLLVTCLALLAQGARAADVPKTDPKKGDNPLVTKTDGKKPAAEALKLTDKLTNADPMDKVRLGSFSKRHSFKMTAGKGYVIDMISTEFDTYLRLEDPTGKEVAKDDDGGEGLNARLFHKAAQTGAYSIVATTYRAAITGAYTLTVAEVEIKEARPIALAIVKGQPTRVESRLTADDGLDPTGKRYRIYAFKGEANTSYSFELLGKQDLQLRLEDERGGLLKNEDTGGAGFSRLLYLVKEPGTYHLIVAPFEGLKGEPAFELLAKVHEPRAAVKSAKVELQPAKVARLSDKLSKDDGVDDKGFYYKSYDLKVEAGQRYQIDAEAQGMLLPQLRLRNTAGAVLGQSQPGGAPRLVYHASAAAELRLWVLGGNPGELGAFNVTVLATEAKTSAARKLPFKAGQALKVEGELTKEDEADANGKHYKTYTVEMKEGQTLKIDLHSVAFDAYLYLKDASGAILQQNDDNGESLDSRIIHKFASAGVYHIVTTSLGKGRTGEYVLSLSEPGPLDTLAARINDFGTTLGDRKEMLRELTKLMQASKDKLGQREARLAMQLAGSFEREDVDLAKKSFQELGQLLSGADEEQAAKVGRLMLGASRRLGLKGQILELRGRTIDGADFDLAKLKGKVVLVDYWATWCGPCRAELPNIKKMYEKYHKDGFEVIGVSLDATKQDALDFHMKDKLPWTSIHDKDGKGGSLADELGIFFIPQAFLVGRDGRVISLNARGADLVRLLDEIMAEKK